MAKVQRINRFEKGFGSGDAGLAVRFGGERRAVTTLRVWYHCPGCGGPGSIGFGKDLQLVLGLL